MRAVQKTCDVVIQVLLVIATVVLAAMMFLMTADVILRYIFGSPLSGSYELLQFMMSVVIPFGIAYCAHEKAHISVDVLFVFLPGRTQRILDCVNALIVLVLFLIIAWQSVLYVKEIHTFGLTSGILYIPSYPFVGATALGFLALCFVLVLDFIGELAKIMEPGGSLQHPERVEK
jgi:TRAP-type C4-dicarboxylate transport system permease small subunit